MNLVASFCTEILRLELKYEPNAYLQLLQPAAIQFVWGGGGGGGEILRVCSVNLYQLFVECDWFSDVLSGRQTHWSLLLVTSLFHGTSRSMVCVLVRGC